MTKKYRPLCRSELIGKTDEWFCEKEKTWKAPLTQMIGSRKEDHLEFRREIFEEWEPEMITSQRPLIVARDWPHLRLQKKKPYLKSHSL